MKIRGLFFLAFILAMLGMVAACKDPNSSDSTFTLPIDTGVVITGTTLAEKLQWLASNAASNKTYILEVSGDEFLNPHTLSYSGKSNISIQLTGIGGVKTVELYGSGSLFMIYNGVTLVLNENIVLKGRTTTNTPNNSAPLVTVSGGNLILNNGSKITGNRISSSGGGVYVYSGTFTMNGGEISGNTSSSSGGGGVYLGSGIFTMNGGEISGNTATINYNSSGGGGGVYVGSGTFIMTGGKISGNTSSPFGDGGGVYLGSGTFTMTGGEISGNTATSGGGVCIGAINTSRFEKIGGTITGLSSDTENGNGAYSRGNAVYAEHNDSRFIRYKNFTAGPQNNLTYIRNEPSPPTISGDWNLPVPDAPDAPVITASGSSLTVQWTAVERALAYEVWMGTTNNSANATKSAEVPGVSATLTELTIGTTYYVWLKAKNDTGTSGFSPMASGRPIVNMGAVTVNVGGSGQLVLSWSVVAEADQYEVYYHTSESIPATPALTVSTTTVTVSGLTNGTTYYVWVKPKNANGTGDANTAVSGTPMATPDSLTISPANQQLTINWAAVPGAASYEIYQNTSATIPASPSFTVTETSRTITGLINGTTYYFWVKAVNANGTSAASPMASGKPIENMGTVTLVSGNGQFVLSWSAVVGVDQYEVYDHTSNSIPATSAQTVSTTTATISGLTNGTTYYVWVKPKNAETDSASTVVSGKPVGNMGTVSLVSGNGQLGLSWSAVAGAEQYEVYYSTTNTIPGSPAETVTTTTATISGLNNGTTYYVWVKPKNAHGVGGTSTAASGKPIGNMGTVSLSVGGIGQLILSWTAVAGADQYEVYYSTVNTMPSNSAQTVSTTTATVSGLVNGTTYYVWVRPKNTNGTGDVSQIASGKPTGVGLYNSAISDNNKIGNYNLSQALTYISSNVVSGDNFYIVLGADESVSPTSLNYTGKTVGITLIGEVVEQKITLASNGSMFTIPANNTGVTLTLDENITLVGLGTNTTSLVSLSSGNLVINTGAKISGNNNSSSSTSGSGGAIRISGGTVTMNSGSINGNTANYSGGGIYISSGTFIMNGGVISGNTATNSGGGIIISGGTVTIHDGTISGNTATNSGGGIDVSSGTFIINGGKISDNKAVTWHGGGIIVGNSVTVTMYGGIISGNTAQVNGGGIYVNGTFKKLPSGGGQNSGIIYGNEEIGVDTGGIPLKNTANSGGHTVATSSMRRNTTAGQTDQIDTAGGIGLSTNGNSPFGQ
jgi:hypothetical protein